MSQATTDFVHQLTVIEAEWCNDADLIIHEVFPGDISLPFFKVDALGNKVLNNSAEIIDTEATAGFVYFPSTDGTPTGEPAESYVGTVPLIWDQTNEILYYYTTEWNEYPSEAYIQDRSINEQWWAFVGSDQSGILTTGVKATIRALPACTIQEIRGFVVGASDTGGVVIDVHVAGSTIMSTDKLDIDEDETTTLTCGTQPVLTTTTITSGDTMTIEIDSAGSNAIGWGVLMRVRY